MRWQPGMRDRPSLFKHLYYPRPQGHWLRRSLFWISWPIVKRITRLQGIDRIYSGGLNAPPDQLEQGCLDEAGITWAVDEGGLDRIPTTGPVLVLANHPYGMADGLLQARLLRLVRPDYKQIVNEMLTIFPELAERYITVDVFAEGEERSENMSPLRSALSWLKEGHLLATFPAGAVSHRTRSCRDVLDPEWNQSIAMLARRSGATIVPMYFHGHNGWFFQTAGLIWERLRTMLIPGCLVTAKGKHIRVSVGQPIEAATLRRCKDRSATIQYLRSRVYMLSGPEPATPTTPQRPMGSNPTTRPTTTAAIASEIDALPTETRLCASGDLSVHLASADAIPAVLEEIGRLREVTFRAVGEGTGNDVDLDAYDSTYRHLFIWNASSEEIVGSYRLGLTDEILRESGIDGFYTRTLFDYDASLLEELGDAIELGRSFIRPEYQRGFKPLMLLWRGISNFAAQERRYRHCFGVVSMSNDYGESSKQLVTGYLARTAMRNVGDASVSARTPYTPSPTPGVDVESLLSHCQSIEDIDTLVRDAEGGRAGVPVLVRQYLKLEARLLAPFNVDHSFADVIDGLMLVDFMQVERRIAHFYLGDELATAFRQHHGFEPFTDDD